MAKTLSRKSHRRGVKSNRRNKSHKRERKHKMNKTRKTIYRGGFGPGSTPIGYPLVYGNTLSWPGVSGNPQGMGNHYALSKVGIPSGPFDPPISSREIAEPFSSSFKYGGSSRRTRHRSRAHRGGGLMPQELVNLGDSINFGVSSLASKFLGSVNQAVNPFPTEDQGIDTNYKIIPAKVPNLYNISKIAYSKAALM